jgi:hypothetical protein
MREVDEPHQSQSDGESDRKKVQDHPVGGPVEGQRDEEVGELEHGGTIAVFKSAVFKSTKRKEQRRTTARAPLTSAVSTPVKPGLRPGS